jgi:WD40 repeat protein
MKSLVLLLCVMSLLLSSCGIIPTVSPIVSKTVIPSVTVISQVSPSASFTLTPTHKTIPTFTQTLQTFTPTPRSTGEPGLIAILGNPENTLGSQTSLVFSPDGRAIAQANKIVRLWDVSTLQIIRELSFPNYDNFFATKIVFSPDGSLLAVNITNRIPTYLSTTENTTISHLLVWEVTTGTLLEDLILENASMIAPEQPSYFIPVNAMAFIPNSTKLAYANGNRIEVLDIKQKGKPNILSLGKEMYASDFFVRDDAEFIYIFMKWHKDHSFPALERFKFRLQVWHLNTKTLRRDLTYDEVKPSFEDKSLVGMFLLHQNYEEGTLKAQNLINDEIIDFPYRRGLKYFNDDSSLMVCIRSTGFDDNQYSLEIWNTDNWRMIYSFKPDFVDDFYSITDVAFSPDNTKLGLYFSGQVAIWDLRP